MFTSTISCYVLVRALETVGEFDDLVLSPPPSNSMLPSNFLPP